MARLTKRAPAPLSYNGVDLTSPAPVKLPATGSIASQVQSATDQANAANNVRYGQGLGVLAHGDNNAQGYIASAIQNSNMIGKAARNQVGLNLQKAQGNTEQSAISRGIGNTTILDSLQRGNTRDAQDAYQSIDEQNANRRSALNLQQAQQSNQGAGSISNFIANRNDVAPDLSTYANLARSAAGSTQGATQSGTTINAPASYTGGLGSGSSGHTSTGGSSGGGSGTYFNNASGGGGAIGGNSGGYFSNGGAVGGTSAQPTAGPIASALSQPVPTGGSFMNNTGDTKITALPDGGPTAAPGSGSMSMTQGANNPQTNASKPYAGQVRSWMYFSGMGPSVMNDFINGGGKVTG